MRPAEARADAGQVRRGPGGSPPRARSRRSPEPTSPSTPSQTTFGDGDVRRDHRRGGHRFDSTIPKLYPTAREHVGSRVPGKLRVGHGPRAQDPAANARRERALRRGRARPPPRATGRPRAGKQHLERPLDLETHLRIEAVHPQDLGPRSLDRAGQRANADIAVRSDLQRHARTPTKETPRRRPAIAASIRRLTWRSTGPASSISQERSRYAWNVATPERSLLGPRASRCSV